MAAIKLSFQVRFLREFKIEYHTAKRLDYGDILLEVGEREFMSIGDQITALRVRLGIEYL